jgi:hypothetical protein
MSSYTTTGTETFTLTHAKHIAAKVATDLQRFHRLYGKPSLADIDAYEQELTILLKYDAIDSVIYGFKRNGLWTMASARYVALPGGAMEVDDDPGRIKPNHDVTGAGFSSFLSYSSRWFALPQSERDAIEKQIPVNRTTSTVPGLEQGAWTEDRNYAAGGRGLGRSTVR